MNTSIRLNSEAMPEVVDVFHKNGFVHIPSAFSGQNLECLIRCTDEIIAAPETP